MGSAIHADSEPEAIGALIELLHQCAPADEFARRLAQVEALPERFPNKSTLVEAIRMAMAIRNRLELQQQRERGMLAVIDSAQDLSSRLDLTSLLSAIVSRARNLLGSHGQEIADRALRRLLHLGQSELNFCQQNLRLAGVGNGPACVFLACSVAAV